MRKILTIAAAILLLTLSFTPAFSQKDKDNDKQKIEGS